jgi:hypothetical protein
MAHIGSRMYRVKGRIETERLDTVYRVGFTAITAMTDMHSTAGLHCFVLGVHLNAELVACHRTHRSALSRRYCTPSQGI